VTTLAQIRGQERVVELLRRAIRQDRVAHAYLFTGPHGCGKHTTAIALALALNCDRAPGEGCGECDVCERILAGNHPDVQTLERQGAAQIIPIEIIRKRVIPSLALPPHEARARFFLIEEATSLHGPAANALLKTLEEPPARTHFILGTTSPDQLLPTIRSRCQRLSFQTLPADLRAELDSDDEAAEQLSAFADALWDATFAPSGNAVYDASGAVSRDRSDVAAGLELFAQRLHAAAREAVFADSLDRAAALSRRASVVAETQIAVIQHNAHGQIAVEQMLFELRALPA
jgi:DNA polymerase III delta' subunit